jgi:hypothetical protein
MHRNQLGRVYRLPCQGVITRSCDCFTYSGLLVMSNIYCLSGSHTGNRAAFHWNHIGVFNRRLLGFAIDISDDLPASEALWRTDGGNPGL